MAGAGVPPQRVMLLRGDLPNGRASVGSGTLIGPRLVLTAAHVVFGDDRRPLTVRVGPPDADLSPGRVLWPDSYDPDAGASGSDAALVEITDPAWTPPRLGPVAWGRLTGRMPGVACEATGFPRALRDPDLIRDTDQLSATINPGSRRVASRYDLHVTSSVPTDLAGEPSPWAGASGAGVFGQGLLIGVLVADEQNYQGRLSALPVHLLVNDPEFAELVAAHGGGTCGPAELGSVELVGLLQPAGAPVYPRRGRDESNSPAGLLRADREAVPFHGRHDILADLSAWCTDPQIGVDVQLLVGPGGQGKSRLARRLAQDLARRGAPDGSAWVTGMIAAETTDATPDVSVLADTDGSLLVVVDDPAEARVPQITGLIRALWTTDSTATARVLLLSRAAGDWWTRLLADLDLPADRVVTLPGLDPSKYPAAGFPAAVTALAKDLAGLRPDVDWAALAATVPAPSDLADPRYEVPLTLQLAALTGLLEADRTMAHHPDEATEATLLRHERRYWDNTAQGAALGLSADTLGQCVAAATLCGAGNRAEASVLLAALPGLDGQTADTRGKVDNWLRDLYPPAQGRWWGSLHPDRVAEYQAATVLLTDPGLLATLLAAAAPVQGQRVFTVLARALTNPALTEDQTRALADQVRLALEAELDRLGPVALRVATQAADPRLLVQAVQDATTHASPEALAVLTATLPQESLALAPLAVALTTRLVDHDRKLAIGADDLDARAQLAQRLNDLSVRLTDLGRLEDAHAAIDEAVTLHRQLAAAHPDRFAGDLAMDLNNQSVSLAAIGRLAEALAANDEALTLHRQLAAAHPDTFTPKLADSLNNQSVCLAALGRPEEALAANDEALTLRHQMAAAHPDVVSHQLAQSWNNQSLRLADVDRLQDALHAIDEALGLYRQLAAAHPDAFSGDLAMALYNQSLRLAGLARPEDALTAAQEAVTRHRRLAAIRPGRFTPDLALSLNNLSLRLGDLNRHQAALIAIDEALTLYQQLAEAHPEAFTSDLAMSLNNRSVILAAPGRRDEALTANHEALTLYRHLAETHPEAFTSNLADSLSNRSVLLAELRRPEEALTAKQEALTHYRQLAETHPEAFTGDLATCLFFLGRRLAEAGMSQEAMRADRESLALFRHLQQEQPALYAQPLQNAAQNLAADLRDLGHTESAIQDTLRQLLGHDP